MIAATATLSSGWILLRDCPLAGSRGEEAGVASRVLLHPEAGIVILDVLPGPVAPDAVGRLRRKLEAGGFLAAFGAFPPVVQLALRIHGLADLGQSIGWKLREHPPLALRGANRWTEAAREILLAAPSRIAPGGPPAAAVVPPRGDPPPGGDPGLQRLAWFWVGVVLLLVGGAGMLHHLGPPQATLAEAPTGLPETEVPTAATPTPSLLVAAATPGRYDPAPLAALDGGEPPAAGEPPRGGSGDDATGVSTPPGAAAVSSLSAAETAATPGDAEDAPGVPAVAGRLSGENPPETPGAGPLPQGRPTVLAPAEAARRPELPAVAALPEAATREDDPQAEAPLPPDREEGPGARPVPAPVAAAEPGATMAVAPETPPAPAAPPAGRAPPDGLALPEAPEGAYPAAAGTAGQDGGMTPVPPPVPQGQGEAGPREPRVAAAAPAVPVPPVARRDGDPAAATQDMPAALRDSLVRRGDGMVALGDISAARLLYGRAAAAGSGRAAAALGRTHDPVVLAGMGVRGIQGDREAAIAWYRRAVALGEETARDWLAVHGAAAVD